MKFRKKPVEIEAITFAELVEYGKANTTNIVNGMPWSFNYKGQPITHANDECYLIPTSEGVMKFTPDDMLITGVKGEIYPCKMEIFEMTYEPANPPQGHHCTAGKGEQEMKCEIDGTEWVGDIQQCPTCQDAEKDIKEGDLFIYLLKQLEPLSPPDRKRFIRALWEFYK